MWREKEFRGELKALLQGKGQITTTNQHAREQRGTITLCVSEISHPRFNHRNTTPCSGRLQVHAVELSLMVALHMGRSGVIEILCSKSYKTPAPSILFQQRWEQNKRYASKCSNPSLLEQRNGRSISAPISLHVPLWWSSWSLQLEKDTAKSEPVRNLLAGNKHSTVRFYMFIPPSLTSSTISIISSEWEES